MGGRSGAARWEVRLHVDPPHPQAWFVHAGLSELDFRGRIHLRFSSRRLPPGKSPWLEVRDHETREEWSVCIDLCDGARLQSPLRTAVADVTFKRSHSREEIGKLSSDVGSRLQPLGLTYMSRSGYERHIVQSWMKMLPSFVDIGRRSFHPRLLARASQIELRLLAARFGSKVGLPPLVAAIEAPPAIGSPRVLFQTRVYDPRTGDRPDREKVNAERVAVIRALRKTLGEQFVGGLVPSEFARKTFRDCLSNNPTEQEAYLASVPQCDICISTTGLHSSNPWKLPEYLAASRAIVTKPLEFELPKPLVEGVNVRTFTTPEECVSICQELLDDPERRVAMKHANHAYYRSEQRPNVLMSNRLEDLAHVGAGHG